MAPSGRADHDGLYHRLFSHPGVVAQLLRGFVDGPWLADLDLDRIERLNAKFHAETGERREGDMIWRIPRRAGDGSSDGETWLLLLLEFQSATEPFMALRVMTYAGLLWQHLIAEGQLVRQRKLPPLLPVVLYNGEARWGAPVAMRELVDLPERSPLWRWQPDLQYHVIDAGAFSAVDLAWRDSLPALWFRLEGAADPAGVVAAADAVIAWLSRHPEYAAMRAVFAELLTTMAARPGTEAPISEEWLDMQSRLVARAQRWQEEWRQEGLQAGRQEGEAALLLRQLERRFGPLPPDVVARVRAADVDALEQCGLRVLDAASLDDVLR
jgi:hypothetical protein